MMPLNPLYWQWHVEVYSFNIWNSNCSQNRNCTIHLDILYFLKNTSHLDHYSHWKIFLHKAERVLAKIFNWALLFLSYIILHTFIHALVPFGRTLLSLLVIRTKETSSNFCPAKAFTGDNKTELSQLNYFTRINLYPIPHL